MKYATLILGAALLLASIITARAVEILNCNGTIIEKVYIPTCEEWKDCRSVKFDGYKISNAPLEGFELRLRTQTPRRGVSSRGPELIDATINGKRCRDPHELDPR